MPDKIPHLLMPFMAMAGGKPKLNTARLIELGSSTLIILSVIWSQIGELDAKVDNIIIQQELQRERLENITTEVHAIKEIVYTPINGD